MDCIEFESKVTHIDLLTHSDKLIKIESLLAKSRHKADLFLPDDSFYGTEVSADDPERMADILFKWLGIKHRSVSIHIDPNQAELIRYSHKKNTSQISFSLAVLENPLLCGAAIAHAIVHHLIVARAKVTLGNPDDDESFTDLGTIYAGFGILIINAFDAKQTPLGATGKDNYASEFLDFCSQQRIVQSVWVTYVLPDVAASYLASDNRTPSKMLKPFIRRRIAQYSKRKQKIFFLAASFTVLVTALLVAILIQPKRVPSEQREKHEAISLLRMQIEHCQKLVAYKMERWDTSDIFMQRQIDADKTRCTSLKNRYNYEVGQLNSMR